MCFHGNQHPWAIKHLFISLYSRYQSLKCICLPVMNSPVFPSLDDIYCNRGWMDRQTDDKTDVSTYGRTYRQIWIYKSHVMPNKERRGAEPMISISLQGQLTIPTTLFKLTTIFGHVRIRNSENESYYTLGVQSVIGSTTMRTSTTQGTKTIKIIRGRQRSFGPLYFSKIRAPLLSPSLIIGTNNTK